ncbi:MAG: replication-associated recombination protein A [Clostridia bacterium]|nr:replication-associated recombination protein A [Clostridia bacterium]
MDKKTMSDMGLFKQNQSLAPLAERMRPVVLNEFVGQTHLISQDSLLSRAIKADKLGSCIFWGPPGCGKTTMANVIANTTEAVFEKLNAVTSGVADAKKIIEQASHRKSLYGTKTYLMLDECHRWSKAQSDCVLKAIEDGTIIFIGSTTENPYYSMTPAIVSRCRVLEFKPIEVDDLIKALQRALSSPNGVADFKVDIKQDALNYIAEFCGGDLRNAYNALELAVLTNKPNDEGVIVVSKQDVEQSMQTKPLSVDRQAYYDMISAFIKSMRGSDPDAAMFWFCRLIESGCDPMMLARRIVICASEDVGLADPMALVVASSALTAFLNVGLPEGRLILTQAILYIANAPKSNSCEETLIKATEGAKAHANSAVPSHLMDKSFMRSSDGKYLQYNYPHDFGGWVEQQYLPSDAIGDVYYTPKMQGQDTGCKNPSKKR